jgi:GntR family transcriptional regulator
MQSKTQPNQFSTRPIYLQLRDALAQRIAKGEWKPGTAIPNETDLAREFGVSPGTMRKALSLLEEERLITRRQGRGTFINDQASDELADRFCSIRGANGQPIPGYVQVGKVTKAPASEVESLRLQLRSRDPVWRFRRVRVHEDQAFMSEEVVLPAELFPQLDASDASRIVLLAQKYGLLLGPAEERIAIGAATPHTAEALHIAQGAPVIVLDRVVHTIEGRPVEWRVGQCVLAANYYLAHLS